MATSNNSICSTCNHKNDCLLQHNGFIWECSEFDSTIEEEPDKVISLSDAREEFPRLAVLLVH